MTQTRIEITDEMVERAARGLWGSSSGTMLKALEAALGPLLERRKGNRRGSELNHVNRRLGLTDDGWDGLGPGGS